MKSERLWCDNTKAKELLGWSPTIGLEKGLKETINWIYDNIGLHKPEFTTGEHMKALILAGGKGRRLMPYTTIIPKPLMPIGDKAILEIVVQQLKLCGFNEIILSIVT